MSKSLEFVTFGLEEELTGKAANGLRKGWFQKLGRWVYEMH